MTASQSIAGTRGSMWAFVIPGLLAARNEVSATCYHTCSRAEAARPPTSRLQPRLVALKHARQMTRSQPCVSVSGIFERRCEMRWRADQLVIYRMTGFASEDFFPCMIGLEVCDCSRLCASFRRTCRLFGEIVHASRSPGLTWPFPPGSAQSHAHLTWQQRDAGVNCSLISVRSTEYDVKCVTRSGNLCSDDTCNRPTWTSSEKQVVL